MKIHSKSLFLVLAILFPCLSIAGPSWQAVNPLIGQDELRGFAHGANDYVLVGTGGLIVYSPDGITWRTISPIVVDDLYAVTWSSLHQQYVAVGDNGRIIFSADGQNWKLVPASGNTLHDVFWNPDLQEYVFIGAAGTILRTTDKMVDINVTQNINFIQEGLASVTATLTALVWDTANQRYIAVGNNGVVLSKDKTENSWRKESKGLDFATSIQFNDVAFDPVHNVYLVPTPSVTIFTGSASRDAKGDLVWKRNNGRDGLVSQISPFISSVAVRPSDGLIVSVGDNGDITSSKDNFNWNVESSRVTENLKKIVWDNRDNKFYAIGQNSRIITSTDGVVWSVGSSWVNSILHDIKFDPGIGLGPNFTDRPLYIAVGSRDTIITSPDSINWTIVQTFQNNTTTNDFNGIAVNPNASNAQIRYALVGTGGTIKTSSDAVTWTNRTSSVTQSLFDIVWDTLSNLFLAVGDNGIALTSSDGAQWAFANTGLSTTASMHAVVHDTVHDKFYSVGSIGSTGKAWTATKNPNGTLNWALSSTGIPLSTKNLTDIAWSPTLGQSGRVVTVGLSGTVFTSDDLGNTWVKRQISTATDLNSVVWDPDNSLYLAVGNGGQVWESSNGLTWVQQPDQNIRNLTSIMWDPGRTITEPVTNQTLSRGSQYLSGGELGTILRRDIEPPVITLIGADPFVIEAGASFQDQGTLVTDNIDTDKSATPDKILSQLPLGQEVITYSATDASGNAASPITRVVIVRDTTSPTITLNDDRRPFPTPLNLPFLDPGITVSDNVNDNAYFQLKCGGLQFPDCKTTDLDVSKEGFYTIDYQVTDAKGNPASITRNVQVIRDTTPPVITVKGSSNITVKQGDRYSDLGAIAKDNVDGDITDITVDNPVLNVNTSDPVAKEKVLTIGTFTITYTATDRSGNVATATRTIVVEPLQSNQLSSGGGGRISPALLLLVLLTMVIRSWSVRRSFLPFS